MEAVNIIFFLQDCERAPKRFGSEGSFRIQTICFTIFTSLQYSWICTIAVNFILFLFFGGLVIKL
jgi:hypothetical protein